MGESRLTMTKKHMISSRRLLQTRSDYANSIMGRDAVSRAAKGSSIPDVAQLRLEILIVNRILKWRPQF